MSHRRSENPWPPRNAVVVGGASGMGEAIASALASLGTSVLVADRNNERMALWQRKIGQNAVTTICDITSDESVAHLAVTARRLFEEIDLVVTTPGMAVLAPPHKVPIGTWLEAIDVNLLGAVRLTNNFLEPMLVRGRGQMMFTGSEAGYRPQSWALGQYGTTKAAVNAYAENLAVYTRGHGVGISLLCPGLVSSNFGESSRMVGIDDPTGWVAIGPSPRVITPEEVADVALRGLSDGRFLIITHPEFANELRDRGYDLDTALAARADQEGVSKLP
jgi:NAD(P)-dependent dehydrogenase (short-subunit alcohol dehydrogenase family)